MNHIDTIRTVEFEINGLSKLYYVDYSTSEVITQGDPRLGIRSCVFQDVEFNCVTICDNLSTDETDQVDVDLTCDNVSSSLVVDGCISNIAIIILVNEEQLFEEESGSIDDVFYGASTYSNMTYSDLTDYINAQPSYMITNQEISFYFRITDCFNYVYTSSKITYNP